MSRIFWMLLLVGTGPVSAATLESVDEDDQSVTLHLTREEQKGCCTPDSRLEVHKNGKSIGDFKVLSYSSRTGRVKLSVEDVITQFNKDAAWTVYLYMGEEVGADEADTSDTTYLSAEDRLITYEKLKANHARLLKKFRVTRKKLNSAERRKLAREVKTAEKLAREYKEKFFDSTVYRSAKIMSVSPVVMVTGYPFTGGGGGLEMSYFMSGDHNIGVLATSVTGKLATENELEVKADHFGLYYRGFLANSFNMSVGAYYGKYTFAPAVTPAEPEAHSGGGLRIGLGNRWQWQYVTAGWDYLDVRIPLYGSKAEGKERDMLLTTFIASSVFSVGISF